MAALQYKPQPKWKMGKKKYKPWLIMARVRYIFSLSISFPGLQNDKNLVNQILHLNPLVFGHCWEAVISKILCQ